MARPLQQALAIYRAEAGRSHEMCHAEVLKDNGMALQSIVNKASDKVTSLDTKDRSDVAGVLGVNWTFIHTTPNVLNTNDSNNKFIKNSNKWC